MELFVKVRLPEVPAEAGKFGFPELAEVDQHRDPQAESGHNKPVQAPQLNKLLKVKTKIVTLLFNVMCRHWSVTLTKDNFLLQSACETY